MQQANRKYDLSSQRGHSIDIPKNATQEDKERILSKLMENAHNVLPHGCVFEIREGIKDSGQAWAAWAYEPAKPYTEESEFRNPQSGEVTRFTHPGVIMTQEPLFMKRLGQGQHIKYAGYYLVGRART